MLVVVSFKRTIELRGALIQALKRIERLEAQLALDPDQRAPLRAPPPTDQSEPPASPPAAETQTEIPAPVITPQPAPAPEPAVARAAEPESTDSATAAPERRIPAPRFGVAAFILSFGCFAALAAAQVHAINPPAGVFIAFLIGLIGLGLAEWKREGEMADDAHLFRALPNQAALIALLSLAILTFAMLHGRAHFNAPSPLIGFLLVSAIAIGAAFLSLRHGVWMLGAAAICGAIAPALLGDAPNAPLARAIFATIFLAVMTGFARARSGPVWAWVGALIAIGWALSGFSNSASAIVWAGACPAFALIGLVYAWDGAAPDKLAEPGGWPESRITGLGLVGAAATLFVPLVIIFPQELTAPAAASFALVIASAMAAAVRPALWPAAFASAAAAILALGFWPAPSAGLLDAPGLISFASALCLIFSLAGFASAIRADAPAAGAMLAAAAPIGAFAALHARIGDLGQPLVWAGAALSIGALNALAHLQWAKTKPNLAAPFAAGAALAVTAALYVLVPTQFAGLALVWSLPILAGLELWRPERGLRLAATLLAPLAAVRLIAPEIYIPTASSPAVIALVFLLACAAALAAARLFENGPAGARSFAAQSCFALGITLLGMMATLLTRHAFTAGMIGAPYASLAEMGINTMIWLGIATLLAWHSGPRPLPVAFSLEMAAAGAAASHALAAGLILINPWWGLAPAPAPSWNGLSAILLGYGAPALMFLGYGALRRRHGLETRAGIAIGVGVLMLFVTTILELRRFYHGGAMVTAEILPAEAWAYNTALLGLAGLILALSADRAGKTLRFLSLGLALATLAKAALFDLSGLDGAGRLLAFLGLVAAGAALIWFYRRFILPSPAQRPKRWADPNLLPPG